MAFIYKKIVKKIEDYFVLSLLKKVYNESNQL